MRRKISKKRQPRIRVKVNSQIRYPEVRVLSDTGEMLGLMDSRDAYFKAQDAGKDLVLVTEKAQPPVVKIIDLAKHKYQMKQKLSKSRKAAKAQELKEIRLKPFMAENDFESRLKKVTTFLEKGHKVRLQLQFRGRQITKKEFGFEMMQKVFDATEEIAEIEIPTKVMGMKMMAQLMPIKKK
ncbi:MAG: translation initiation factor IF-3 [Patescibacteria group bacterium]